MDFNNFSSDGPISSGCYFTVDFGTVDATAEQQTDAEFLHSCGISGDGGDLKPSSSE